MTVINAGGLCTLVVGHLLGDFKLAAIAQVFSDAGFTKRVAADAGVHLGA